MNQNCLKYGLGVMNITPNSFSDPAVNLSPVGFEKSLRSFLDKGFARLDFGAESTAPKNAGLVDEKEEWRRIEEYLLPKLIQYKNEFSRLEVFSLDTYRFVCFEKFEQIFRSLFPDTILVWNDVSGVIDQSLDIFLKNYEEKIRLGLVKYVASFTFVEKREDASFHMNYTKDYCDIVTSFLKREKEYHELFRKNNLERGLILDPAFGFSKTYEQNLKLLEFCFTEYVPLVESLLIGLSRKSFLREKLKRAHPELVNADVNLLIERSESEHRLYLQKLISWSKQQSKLSNFWLRVHNPNIIE